MALAFVQSRPDTGGVGSPLTTSHVLTFAVTAGNALVACIYQVGTTARTFVVSDSQGGTWVKRRDYTLTVGGPEIWTCASHPGGSTTVTITHNSASGDFRASVAEFSGFGGVVSVAASDQNLDPGVVNTGHVCSAVGVSAATECLGIISAGSDSTWTLPVAVESWAAIGAGTRAYAAYKIFSGGVTGERGLYSNTGTARAGRNSIALFVGLPTVTVSSISPESGDMDGADAVTITGTGFASGATVTIGGASAFSVSVVNATTITCVTPAGSAGARDVVVTNADTSTGTLAAGFTYEDPAAEAGVTQASATTNVSTSGTTLTLTGTTAGQSLIVAIVQTDADSGRDWIITDNVHTGAYPQVLKYNPSRAVACYALHNITGGDVTLTCTRVGGYVVAYMRVWEVGGLDNIATPTVGTAVDATNATSHPCSTGLTTDRPGFLVTASAFNGTTGTLTAASNYTGAAGATAVYFQYWVAEAGVTANTATFTSGTSRTATSLHVFFPAGESDAPTDDASYVSWFGL